MNRAIIIIRIENNAAVVLVRQRAHALAELAGFDNIKQTSFATALSEISRNALQFAQAGRVDFTIENHGAQAVLVATVSDDGPGIALIRAHGGHWNRSLEFPGHGIASARKLVKHFSMECPPSGGTIVKLGLPFQLGQKIPPQAISDWTARLASQQPRSFLEEMQHRNQELVATLEAFQIKEIELERQMAQDHALRVALADSHQLLEARVVERTESLLRSNEELRAFTYTVSHDLRAPLRSINGFIHLLVESHVDPADEPAAELTESIVRSTSRMDALIQDLVAYTQISRVPIPVQPLDCRTLIEQMLQQCRVRLHPAVFRVETRGEFPTITANAAILESALTNLFDNAFKFRKPATDLTVCFRGTPNGKHLRLWIEDEGIGIAPEHHERIFRVFERLHGYEVPGTGIGLALVRRWIAGMGGTVGVESVLGQGARFWIDLPLSAQQQAG